MVLDLASVAIQCAIARGAAQASGYATVTLSTHEPSTVPQTSHHFLAPRHAGRSQPMLQSGKRCFPSAPGDGKAAGQARKATASVIAREAARASGCATAMPSTHEFSTVQQT